MGVPFHRVKVCGDILVAARGASVHTFTLADGSHVASWQLPQPESKQESPSAENEKVDASVQPVEASDTPPSKRRKLAEEPASSAKPAEDGEEVANPPQHGQQANGGTNGPKNQKKNRKQHPKKDPVAALRSGDLPIISILEATSDGRHVVVVMGHDKTVRVLAHDLQGHLQQISERIMPKRPSSVALTADDQTILSADKFGDVYALPLVKPEKGDEPAPGTETASAGSKESTPAPPAVSASMKALKLKANRLTVHTKGNLQALDNQIKQLERLQREQEQQAASGGEATPAPAAAQNNYQLVLGHVSMLTAVIVAEAVPKDAAKKHKPGVRRPLILTADRDEHIRVTRGILGSPLSPGPSSQTHVIETFCLGHTSFVSRLCIPAGRPDRLVSGGGDGELVVWDFWPTGTAVGRVALGPLVADAMGGHEGAAKIALAGLYTFAGQDGAKTPCIVAICERVPALFFFRLEPDGRTLAHVQTLKLSGKGLPLDVAVVDPSHLVVAAAEEEELTQQDKTAELVSVSHSQSEGWSVADTPFSALPEELPGSVVDVEPAAIRNTLLKSIEGLRKGIEDGVSAE